MSLSQREREVQRRELHRRKKAQESLHSYALSIQIPLAPNPPFEELDELAMGPARLFMPHHIGVMLDVLERTVTRPMGRAMIMMPPGSAKSSYTSVVLPSWVMGRVPKSRIIMTSYATPLAERQSRRCQQICRSPEYANVWDTPLAPVRDAAGDWALNNESELIAAGLLAGITGNRACFVGSTQVLTAAGWQRIDAITRDTVVYGYDHTSEEIVQRKVRGTRVLRKDRLVRVRTEGGREFICTADHPVYVSSQGRYTEAQLLERGDTLIGADVSPLRAVQAPRIESLPSVLPRGESRGQDTALHLVRHERNSSNLRVGEAGPERHTAGVLRAQLRGDAAQPHAPQTESYSRAKKVAQIARYLLRHLWANVSSSKPLNALLRHGVQKRRTFAACTGAGQRSLEARSVESVSAAFLQTATSHSRAGQRLRSLPRENATAVPPHRRNASPQQPGQPGDALRSAPPYGTQQDRVALVEQLHGLSEPVYDIEVEGTHNFFAEGVLVHNSGFVIDDPVKGRQDADSPQFQASTIEAYQDDLLTRVLPGAWGILIMTRWNENDLAGSILPEDYAGQSGMVLCRDGLYWEVLNVPAKAEHVDDPLGRQLGEYLWTEYFPVEHWQMFERGQSRAAQRTWSSLYQQRPVPEGNTNLDKSKIQWVKAKDFPKRSTLRVAIVSDFAVTEKSTADWSEHACFGIDNDGNAWLLDTWSGQVTADKSIDALLDMASRNGVRTVFDEKGVIHNSVGPALNKAMREKRIYLDVRPQSSNADKVAKVQGFIAIANTGIVHAPTMGKDRIWMEQALAQVEAMPAGRHDDKADVLGLLGRVIDQILNAPSPPPARKEGIKPFSAAWVEWKDEPSQKLRYR
jgi:predicted phage terminase large subunit-like protein